MLFRQLIDNGTKTYTYLIAEGIGGTACIIDSVNDHYEHYCQLIKELSLELTMVIDTHTHADHITCTGKLREKFGCGIAMSEHAAGNCITQRLQDGDTFQVGNLTFKTIYTPGHTDDCCSFYCNDRVFTGDTLLIRGTGRTDFQSGNAHEEYRSITEKLFSLPDDTLVYPGHDYKGMTVSTIGEEKQFNPRLQVNSADEYAAIMNNLNLPKPKNIEIAVPANLQCGLVTHQETTHE